MAMTPRELQDVVRKYWIAEFKDNPLAIFAEAPIRFGDLNKDAFLHHLEIDCGITLEIDHESAGSHIYSYTVVDEKKYIIFLLRWT
ncbi:MAG: hypothetical protein ACOVLB_04925 [Candidatus Nanopelagicus sp.]